MKAWLHWDSGATTDMDSSSYYLLLTGIFLVIALLFALVAIKFLARTDWILGFLRGSFGVSLILIAAVMIYAALDLRYYIAGGEESTVATVSFEQLEAQYFEATVSQLDGESVVYPIYGDLWQMKAGVLRWNLSLPFIDIRPGYRLQAISGRYYSLEQERTSNTSDHDMNPVTGPLDLWQWLKDRPGANILLTAELSEIRYIPMSDGALYKVVGSKKGLQVVPLNQRAKRNQ